MEWIRAAPQWSFLWSGVLKATGIILYLPMLRSQGAAIPSQRSRHVLEDPTDLIGCLFPKMSEDVRCQLAIPALQGTSLRIK